MATNDVDSPLGMLRAALQAAGYSALVAEADIGDSRPDVAFDRLTAALLDAVVPAMRARAAAIRLLGGVEVEGRRLEGEWPGDHDIRVPLKKSEAERLEALADELERGVRMLR